MDPDFNDIEGLVEDCARYLREHYHDQGFRYGEDLQDYEDIEHAEFEEFIESQRAFNCLEIINKMNGAS
jgi:hypothetical protein